MEVLPRLRHVRVPAVRLVSSTGGSTPSTRNPLPGFTAVGDEKAEHFFDHDQFIQHVKDGTLPSVAWVVPGDESDHPQSARWASGRARRTSRA